VNKENTPNRKEREVGGKGGREREKHKCGESKIIWTKCIITNERKGYRCSLTILVTEKVRQVLMSQVQGTSLFLAVLEFELRAWTLSHSTSPFLCWGCFQDRVLQTLLFSIS
jgi:hypothetical protein